MHIYIYTYIHVYMYTCIHSCSRPRAPLAFTLDCNGGPLQVLLRAQPAILSFAGLAGRWQYLKTPVAESTCMEKSANTADCDDGR